MRVSWLALFAVAFVLLAVGLTGAGIHLAWIVDALGAGVVAAVLSLREDR